MLPPDHRELNALLYAFRNERRWWNGLLRADRRSDSAFSYSRGYEHMVRRTFETFAFPEPSIASAYADVLRERAGLLLARADNRLRLLGARHDHDGDRSEAALAAGNRLRIAVQSWSHDPSAAERIQRTAADVAVLVKEAESVLETRERVLTSAELDPDDWSMDGPDFFGDRREAEDHSLSVW